jgi:hypothetical protein
LNAIALLAVLAIPVGHPLTAQEPTMQQNEGSHARYKLIDLGTFGGPASYSDFGSGIVNGRGTTVGWADTSTPDPFQPNCLDSDSWSPTHSNGATAP